MSNRTITTLNRFRTRITTELVLQFLNEIQSLKKLTLIGDGDPYFYNKSDFNDLVNVKISEQKKVNVTHTSIQAYFI